MADDLTIPPTEIEISELNMVLLPAGRLILRRLAFQRDMLREQVASLTREKESWQVLARLAECQIATLKRELDHALIALELADKMANPEARGLEEK